MVYHITKFFKSYRKVSFTVGYCLCQNLRGLSVSSVAFIVVSWVVINCIETIQTVCVFHRTSIASYMLQRRRIQMTTKVYLQIIMNMPNSELIL